jgi:hypothetical protein
VWLDEAHARSQLAHGIVDAVGEAHGSGTTSAQATIPNQTVSRRGRRR